jgi:hypothetical protein
MAHKSMLDPAQFRVLNPQETYTFSRYFELPYPIQEIVADLGYRYQREQLELPTDPAIQSRAVSLHQVTTRNLK